MTLVIALDPSLTDTESFKDQKYIAKRVVNQLASQVPKYQIHVVLYDGDTIPSRLFTKEDSLKELDNVIDFIPQFGGERRTEKGLAFASSLFKKPQIASQEAMKIGSSKVLLFFATGPQSKVSNGIRPKDAARELRDLGVNVLAVGTKRTPLSILQNIGQGNSIKMPSNGISLDAFANSVAEKICGLVRRGNCHHLNQLIIKHHH